MHPSVQIFFTRLKRRVLPFFDMTALTLFAVSLIPLALVDFVMVKSLVQWSAFGLSLAAMTVTLGRVLMPKVHLTDFVKEAERGNVAAAVVVLSVSMLMASVFLGLVLWSKA